MKRTQDSWKDEEDETKGESDHTTFTQATGQASVIILKSLEAAFLIPLDSLG